MDTLLNNIFSNVAAEPIVFLSGILLGRVWQRARLRRPVHWYWRLTPDKRWPRTPDNRVLVAASLHRVSHIKRSFYIPIGDTLAVAEVTSLLKHTHRNFKHTFHQDPQSPLMEWNETTVLIGGGKDNLTERCLLAALRPPLYEQDHLHPRHDFKGLKNREGETLLTTTPIVDFGYIIRTLDPLNHVNYVYVIVGGHTVGTYAAARWITQPKNLRWIERKCMMRRITNFIKRRAPFDSIQVVLTVVFNRSESRVLPSVAEPKVWYRDAKASDATINAVIKKPDLYYFQTPPDYAEEYSRWSSSVTKGYGRRLSSRVTNEG